MDPAATRSRTAGSPASRREGEGLWIPGVQHTDIALVLAESGIDALSYAALHPDDNARYASFGGAMNPFQPALIRASIERLAPGATVRIATDNDEDGAGFAAAIEGQVAETGRGDLAVERAVPADAKNWNDVLLRASRVALAIG